MAGIYRQSFDDSTQGPEVQLLGGTDGNKIGNVGDRLKTTTEISAGGYFRWSSKLRGLDINATNGGAARNTTVTNAAWTIVYSYTGSGHLASFLLSLSNLNNWLIRLVIDGEEVFVGPTGAAGLVSDDIVDDQVYDLDGTLLVGGGGGITGLPGQGQHTQYNWVAPLGHPVYYASSVSIQLRRVAGAGNATFRAGAVVLSKES